jgi:Arc/MetJ-type ribon-helix-helix transcriptional regulator
VFRFLLSPLAIEVVQFDQHAQAVIFLSAGRRKVMAQFPPDVQALIKEHMASGRYPSEDELFRDALKALTEETEDLDAVREAVGDLQSGDLGVPLDEAFETIRQKHHVPQGA